MTPLKEDVIIFDRKQQCGLVWSGLVWSGRDLLIGVSGSGLAGGPHQ